MYYPYGSINKIVSFSSRRRTNQGSVLHTIQYGLEFDLTTEQSKHLLKRHVNSNTMMVVLFVDINGSTQMSITLPPVKFATI